VLDRVASIEELDAARIARAIGFTRFPYSLSTDENEIDEEGALLRAADLIGQLGDPHYLRKANALSTNLRNTFADVALTLGTWQGIYVAARPHAREVLLQFMGSRR
jgi:hypothetical protein